MPSRKNHFKVKKDDGRLLMALESLSLFVGTGKCNAHCLHCAGKVHRRYAPIEDGIIDERLIRKTLEECYEKGARSLSISSSGEPTLSPLSVTKALEIVNEYAEKGKVYSPINLYSNGIRIGEDKEFCDNYLNLWRTLGLNWIYITVHSVDEMENARCYGIDRYPKLETVIERIHNSGLKMRANLVLSKETINSFGKFVYTIERLREVGADKIAAWCIRNNEDKVDAELSPERVELEKMEQYSSGKEYLRILTEKHRDIYTEGRKLTLFPDGTLSNTWCN
jgi:MoaA/NifB/PqqE/SkfB family radical SAM enzyme